MEPAEGLHVADLALDIWMASVHRGFVVGEAGVPALLAGVDAHFRDRHSRRLPEGLAEVLAPQGGGEPALFYKLLRARQGSVHFLFFWKALGELSRLARQSAPSAGARDGLMAELETLRDEVLRRLSDEPACRASGEPLRSSEVRRGASEGPPPPPPPRRRPDDPEAAAAWQVGVPASLLLGEAHRAAAMSSEPTFWASATELFRMVSAYEWLGMQELTSTFLAWFHEAALYEHAHGTTATTRRPSNSAGALLHSDVAAALPPPASASGGFAVKLHIYDVSKVEYVQTMNMILAHEYSPVKFGGAFHTGVEVNGLEWSFGFSGSETKPGVSCIKPKTHPQHHYRETVDCGRCALPADRLERLIAQLLEEYPGPDYDLLRRNCCHFADDFLKRLGVGGIPSWIHRLARVGAHVTTMLEAALAVRDQVFDAPAQPELPRASSLGDENSRPALARPVLPPGCSAHIRGGRGRECGDAANYAPVPWPNGASSLPPRSGKFVDPMADFDDLGIYGSPFNPGPL
eukprot:TRINITY_DN32911_c0_g1_i1.p1 TRINITY_DN32911_c0_g1~~TRINITY_DN32911_c0_g1_i1.p1  ORF type:complete len:518 (+),score=103.41 TRINITY_DN32911_c0_g1_i1:87-1640(+)